jgi:hypothetical protein
MRFSPDNDMQVALDKARKATRRGDAAAAARWLSIADQHMSVALRLDMHRWMVSLKHDAAAMRARTFTANREVRKWKADVPWPLPQDVGKDVPG